MRVKAGAIVRHKYCGLGVVLSGPHFPNLFDIRWKSGYGARHHRSALTVVDVVEALAELVN
jgi:hypothetical protein